jgi:hypothetical protein
MKHTRALKHIRPDFMHFQLLYFWWVIFYVVSIIEKDLNDFIWLSAPERLERGGPCRLLKLRRMGTHGGHLKEVLPWLDRWAKYFFPHRTLFHFICPPSPSKLGQAVVQRRLSLNKCLWFAHSLPYRQVMKVEEKCWDRRTVKVTC